MNAVDRRAHFIAGGALLSLAALSFSLACLLTTDKVFLHHAALSLPGRLLGESRRAIGGNFCLQADRYFHRGVGHEEEEAPAGFIQRLADEVQPRVPEHLSGGEIYEMMPWLRFATRMDPHNVDAYLSAAFWTAAQKDGHQEQALAILAEARRNNPSDYRVPMQRAEILLRYGVLAEATRSFDLALKLWPDTQGINAAQKQLDRAALLNYRGFLYELDGRTPEALSCYREHLRIKPGADGMRNVLQAIERGQRSRADAELLLRGLMEEKVTPDEACHHDEGHEHKTHEMHLPPLELRRQ